MVDFLLFKISFLKKLTKDSFCVLDHNLTPSNFNVFKLGVFFFSINGWSVFKKFCLNILELDKLTNKKSFLKNWDLLSSKKLDFLFFKKISIKFKSNNTFWFKSLLFFNL